MSAAELVRTAAPLGGSAAFYDCRVQVERLDA